MSMVRYGWVRSGTAWLGEEGSGAVWLGMAWHGLGGSSGKPADPH